MTTAIVRREITPDVWAMIERIAPTMQKSRLFGVATVEQAASIMLKGVELGLPLTASFDLIHVIDGKPSLSPRGALALVLQSSEYAGMEINEEADEKTGPKSCTVTMKRKNGLVYTTRFSMDDARRAGIAKPDSGWAKYPAQMLKWRCVGFCIDVVFPDVIGGMKRADELGGTITPEGDVVDAEWKVTWTGEPPNVTAKTSTPPKTPAVILNELIGQYGADLVLATCNNAPPTTLDDVNELADKLKAAQAAKVDFTPNDLPEEAPA